MGVIFVTIALWCISYYVKLLSSIHIIQLEGYSTKRYGDWVKENKKHLFYISDCCVFLIAIGLFNICVNTTYLNNIYVFLLLILSLFSFLISVVFNKRRRKKKPLVYTNRVKRLITICLLITLVICCIYYLLSKNIKNEVGSNTFFLLYFTILPFLCHGICFIGNIISGIIESKINKKYYNNAKNIIEKLEGLKVVGITGSYGKTSVKFIATTILSEKYNVLCTPESYNTSMGVCKVVNNTLNAKTDIFVVEMGATKNGDIKEITKLVNPMVGVITSIGPCHLKTFKSLENIVNTKYEIIEYMKKQGIAIFNYDDVKLRELANKTTKRKLTYAIHTNENVDVWANNIVVNEEGSSFNLLTQNNIVRCKTKLLGKHNIYNILAGVCIGLSMNMTLDEIRDGISKIEPITHRLELLNKGNGVLVIDDAYNSNPKGAECALEVLNGFENRRKIIVTPGMVELGQIEFIENKKLGEKIAKVCDIAILVGEKRTKAIYEGLIGEEFDNNNIYIVNSIEESTEVLKGISKLGDVILYENDLPDNYI